MLNVFNAEWIKLRSTKALWWTTALVLLFSLGMSALMGLAMGSTLDSDDVNTAEMMDAMGGLNTYSTLSGFLSFGIVVVLIQAIMMVTSEYGHNTQKTSVIAIPARWKLPVAKFVIYGVFAAVLAFITSLVSIFVFNLTFGINVDDSTLLDMVGLSADHVWDYIGRAVLATVLNVMIAIGVGYIIRHTAGAIAFLLLWKMVLEPMTMAFPKVRDWLPQWMPFMNLEQFLQRLPMEDAPWADALGSGGSLLYFVIVTVLVFVGGIVVLQKRDV